MMKELKEHLWGQEKTCGNKSINQVIENAVNTRPEVIHNMERPVHQRGGIKILRGNLAPEGL